MLFCNSFFDVVSVFVHLRNAELHRRNEALNTSSALSKITRQLIIDLDLAPFAFTVRALRARTVNAGFGGAKRRRNQLIENAARSELTKH